jgi:PPP family 3-phenylpropionic acid transporter
MPFFPLWLKAKGLEPGWIGVVLAIPTVARLTAVPLVTRTAERHQALTHAIVATSMLTVAGFAVLAVMPGPLTIAAMLLVAACAFTPTIPLTDAYALRGVALHGADYGPIRLWGSAAYIAGVLAAGFVATAIAADRLILIIVAVAILAAVSALTLDPLAPVAARTTAPASSRSLLRQPAFVAIAVAAALIQGSHAAYYSFSAIAWRAEGLSATTISALWSLCIVAEIILFAVSPRLDLAYSTLIIVGGLGAALRWAVTAWEPSIAVLIVVQTMHALSFGATHLGTMGLLAHRVPANSIATAQGYLAASIGLVSAAATVASGSLFNGYGQSIYYGAAVMAAAGALVMLAMRRQVEGGAPG